MIIKPHYAMSLLIAASAAQLRADCDWKDVATAGLIGAGIGACIYAAASSESPCTESPRHIHRNTDNHYEKIYLANRRLIDAYHARSYDQIMHYTTRKGTAYQPDRWYIASTYRDSDCREQAPLLRGYAALLNECEELRAYRNELINYWGSRSAARHNYWNFDNLEALARTLQEIATSLERQHIFAITRDNLNCYRANKEELARAKRQLAQAQADLAAWNRRPAYTNGYDYYRYDSRPSSEMHYGINLSFYN